MSHRIEQKQARREARARAASEAVRREQRNRRTRQASYAAVGLIAAVLVTLAVVLGGGSGGGASTDPMAAHGPAEVAGGGDVGTKAPDFKLTDVVSGGQLTRASLAGKRTMLFFSEGVNCQACMVQAADLEKTGALAKKGIRLVSVTTDPADQLAEAARQYGITTPVLADPTTEMSQAYGMLGHGGMQHPTQDGHAFMLLDAKGKILWHRDYQEMYVPQKQLLRDMHAEMRA